MLFTKQFILKTVALLTILAFATNTSSMSMQEVFDSVNANGNVSNPGVLQGQTMNLATGGSMFMRTPKRTYQLANATAPSWNAGCGGIDLYMGGFGFINKDAFVAMLRNIGSNALGYGFKLAIQNLCPTCDNVMQALQASANAINRMNIDSCEAAKGIVNAATPDSWDRSKQSAAKNYGVDMNIFENITDAWTNVMKDGPRAGGVVDQAKAARPEVADSLPVGNIVWKSLKKLGGITDEERELLMSISGSVIFPAGGVKSPIPLHATRMTVADFVGVNSSTGNIKIPYWKCDEYVDCMNPVEAEVEVIGFKKMVNTKMSAISARIAGRTAHSVGEQADLIAFLNVTDIPVYKMLAVATSAGNSGIADGLIGNYEDLIAAKYAEVYLRRATTDLLAAITKFQMLADPTAQKSLENLVPDILTVAKDAKEAVALAYRQTTSTYNIAQEVGHMERALNANMSQTLKTSMAFGRSLR